VINGIYTNSWVVPVKICIIGDPYGVHDIGERKAVGQIVHELMRSNEVLVLRPRDVLSPNKIRRLRGFQPKIIHYWAGPRLQSVVILWAFKKTSRAKASLITAIRPEVSRFGLLFARYFKPNLILAQSEFYLNQFRKFGFNTAFFPNGVDTKVFFSVDEPKKQELRLKYSIPLDKYVVLHVGHITPWRSLGIFSELAADRKNHILIIGSTSLFKPYDDILKSLRDSGCDVRLEFFQDIAEIYQLADCFVFPGGSESQVRLPLFRPERQKVPGIEIPLSVLEAAACGLQVVTSRFGGLEKCPGSGEGIYFFDSQYEIPDIIERIKSKGTPSQKCGKIVDYDWKNVSAELLKIYEEFKRT